MDPFLRGGGPWHEVHHPEAEPIPEHPSPLLDLPLVVWSPVLLCNFSTSSKDGRWRDDRGKFALRCTAAARPLPPVFKGRDKPRQDVHRWRNDAYYTTLNEAPCMAMYGHGCSSCEVVSA
jgi:hypothetical protein